MAHEGLVFLQVNLHQLQSPWLLCSWGCLPETSVEQNNPSALYIPLIALRIYHLVTLYMVFCGETPWNPILAWICWTSCETNSKTTCFLSSLSHTWMYTFWIWNSTQMNAQLYYTLSVTTTIYDVSKKHPAACATSPRVATSAAARHASFPLLLPERTSVIPTNISGTGTADRKQWKYHIQHLCYCNLYILHYICPISSMRYKHTVSTYLPTLSYIHLFFFLVQACNYIPIMDNMGAGFNAHISYTIYHVCIICLWSLVGCTTLIHEPLHCHHVSTCSAPQAPLFLNLPA